MAGRFIDYFGTEELAMQAILNGDIADISGVEGVGQRYAISLVHEVRAGVEGVNLNDFLKTKESIDIYERLLDLVKQFAHTHYAKEKLHIYIPYPSSRASRIEEIRNLSMGYIEIAKKLKDNEQFISLLSQIHSPELKYPVPRIRDRVMIASREGSYSRAKARFGHLMDVQLVKGAGEFVDISRGYAHVIAVDDQCLSFDLPEDVDPEFVPDIEKAEDWSIVPELEIAFFAKNLKTMENACRLVEMMRKSDVPFLNEVSPESITSLHNTLSLINEQADVRQGCDPQIDRLDSILEQIDSCISVCLEEANNSLGCCLEESELTLSGQDMLKMMNGTMEIKDLLEKKLYRSYSTVVNDTRKKIAEQLGLEKGELLYLDDFFPDEISHPLEVESSHVQSFKDFILKKIQQKKIEHKRKIAGVLSTHHDISLKMVRELLDFDVGFAIGCFAVQWDLNMPVFLENNGISLQNARNLFILSRHGEVIPIDYSVGQTSHDPDRNNSNVILLSGVNSGGKTSMLELLSQCIILAQMGFPVPASSLEISLTDGLYYFAKSKGTLDAGAFETTLTDFSVVANESAKIVLVDELESITEPGASARIIAGILEMLSSNKASMAVFVSHLSELILESTNCSVRVDGIEARGLDSDLNLIVDRNPRYNYVARSTPELIVERLSKMSEGPEQQFYQLLRDKFRD